jgi:SulP family sulfate permease
MNAWMPWKAWAHRVNRVSLKQDALAGLTGALIVLPQGIAYSAIAGLPPEFGLYCAIGPAAIAALFGSSWQLVSGPTAAISIVVFSALSPLARAGSPEYIVLALTLGFLVGAIQLAIGVSRLGRLAHYISHSVVVGFTSGAAFLIAASQLKHFLGLKEVCATGFFGQLGQVFSLLHQSQWPIIAVGTTALAASLAAQRIHRSLPYMIVGMVSAAVLAEVLGNVPTVGALPAALPRLSMPSFDPELWAKLAASSAIVAILALTEAIAIARSVALRSGQTIDSNQEIVGQGLSNLAGSFLCAYPSSGSFTRSGLNYDAGAKTPLAAAFSSLFLVAVLAMVTDWISYLPMAAMAGVLFLVAWGLIDRKEIGAIFRGPRNEILILAVTFLSTLLVRLEYAVFIGIALSLFFRRMGFAAEDAPRRRID